MEPSSDTRFICGGQTSGLEMIRFNPYSVFQFEPNRLEYNMINNLNSTNHNRGGQKNTTFTWTVRQKRESEPFKFTPDLDLIDWYRQRPHLPWATSVAFTCAGHLFTFYSPDTKHNFIFHFLRFVYFWGVLLFYIHKVFQMIQRNWIQKNITLLSYRIILLYCMISWLWVFRKTFWDAW